MRLISTGSGGAIGHRSLHTALAVAVCAAFGYAPAAVSLDVDRLWLPTQHRVHYLKLKEAAEIVEATEQCAEVLRATLDLDLSSSDTPWYRILCRGQAGGSFSELVNGVTLQPRSHSRNTEPPETLHEREARLAAEALAAEKLAEQRRQEAAEQERLVQLQAQAEAEAQAKAEEKARAEAEVRQQVLGEVCQSEILARTRMMINLAWVTEAPVAEFLENGQMRFYAEFNAEDTWGKSLHYQAVCTISTPVEFVVIVSPR